MFNSVDKIADKDSKRCLQKKHSNQQKDDLKSYSYTINMKTERTNINPRII